MTTKRQAGLAFQRWIKAWLEERDWLVHNQTPSGRMIRIKGKPIYISQKNDIFSCFDLIAKKVHLNTLWIQATLHKSLKEKTKNIDEKIGNQLTDNDNVQVWMKRESGVVDIYWFDLNMKEWVLIGKIIRRKFYVTEGERYEY